MINIVYVTCLVAIIGLLVVIAGRVKPTVPVIARGESKKEPVVKIWKGDQLWHVTTLNSEDHRQALGTDNDLRVEVCDGN